MKDDDNNASFKYSTFPDGLTVGVYECYADAATEGELPIETTCMIIGITLRISPECVRDGIFIGILLGVTDDIEV